MKQSREKVEQKIEAAKNRIRNALKRESRTTERQKLLKQLWKAEQHTVSSNGHNGKKGKHRPNSN